MREFDEPDWQAVAALWREQDVPVDLGVRLHRRVKRHTRLMWATVIGEVVILSGFAAFTYWFVSRGVTGGEGVILALLWGTALGLIVFGHRNRRGLWRAAAADGLAYLDLMERRARGKVRAAWAVASASGLQGALVAALVVARGAALEEVLPLVALAVLASFAWSVWYGRKAHREAGHLSMLRAQMERDSAQPPM
jgi:hypothetical protein